MPNFRAKNPPRIFRAKRRNPNEDIVVEFPDASVVDVADTFIVKYLRRIPEEYEEV